MTLRQSETKQTLRQQAEAKIKAGGEPPPKALSLDEANRLLHELQVHQIELALQNEELHRTKLHLEQSHARYMDLYDHAPVGYFTFDRRGLILEANLTGGKQLGLERASLLHKPFSSFMCQSDADLFYLHLRKVFAYGTKQSCSLTLVNESGKPFFAQIDSVASASAPVDAPLCQSTITDISARKELEETLKISEGRYRGLFEAMREGIVFLDGETEKVLDVNPFLLEMLGYTLDDFLGRPFLELSPFKDIEALQTVFSDLRRRMHVRHEKTKLMTKKGRFIAVEFLFGVHLVNKQEIVQCNIRELPMPATGVEVSVTAPGGVERRVCERRRGIRAVNEQLKQEIKEHQQIQDDLVSALAEIKALKDRLVLENIYFHQETSKKHQFENIIGQSDGLKYVLYRVEQVAPTNATVLIQGETGTGKELIAAAIHNLSPRKDRPLITVNCAAMPANLLESELFGREKGAYTGADTQQIGRFEIANGSTLCLDEIGEMPMEMQSKLLRVIQHNEFERLGSSKTIKVDVRIVATTNRNLEEAIRAGKFRQDLFYRLNVFPLTVPPLRQRKEDIPLLVQAFVERYARRLGKQITSIPKETMKALMDYPWPGNVRELESIIERAMILCPGPGFQLADKLTAEHQDMASEVGTLKEMELRQIQKALSETQWRIEGKKGAAILLGLHPSTLRARMHRLGIVRPADSKLSG